MNRMSVLFALSLCLAFPVEARLLANQIVLPGSIQVAGSGRDHEPAAAFNTVNRTWLVVWREAASDGTGGSSILGRIVREDRTILTAPFVIGIGVRTTAPRVAHDPLRNEWLVILGVFRLRGGRPRAVIFRRGVMTGWSPPGR
jgi:hypothetical protein